jgi:hypothetical protein
MKQSSWEHFIPQEQHFESGTLHNQISVQLACSGARRLASACPAAGYVVAAVHNCCDVEAPLMLVPMLRRSSTHRKHTWTRRPPSAGERVHLACGIPCHLHTRGCRHPTPPSQDPAGSQHSCYCGVGLERAAVHCCAAVLCDAPSDVAHGVGQCAGMRQWRSTLLRCGALTTRWPHS